MRILVTGGYGFIGSNIIKELNRRGYTDIIVVDDFTKQPDKFKNLIGCDISGFVPLEKCKENMTDKETTECFFQFDVVFHQGACSDTMEGDADYMMRNNYNFTMRLLSECLKANPDVKFVYASSGAVYGAQREGEERKEAPLNIYGYSKYLLDRSLENAQAFKLACVYGLRYTNVYGAGESHKARMMSPVSKFYNQLKENGKAIIFKDTNHVKRDFVYIDDVVDVNMFMAFDERAVPGIYDVGSGMPRTFLDVYSCIQESAPLFSKGIEHVDFPENLKGKYQEYTKADLAPLREMGYDKPMTTLEHGVRQFKKTICGK